MKHIAVLLLLVPVSGETLHYVINWPSGLNLGEATLTIGNRPGEGSQPDASAWEFSFDIDASVPGFAIRDRYHSKASGADVCSAVLEKTVSRGSHKSEEIVNFDQDQHTITRETRTSTGPGGHSSLSVPPCARDALSFLQFARHELAGGRLAPQQPVILGGAYNVRLEFSGTETVKSPEITKSDKPVQADRIKATIKGASSDYTVQILFAKDATRTPVLIRIPLSLGTFTAELTH